MFRIDHGTKQPYRGPERRYAFFPRRLRSGEIPGEPQGTDRRSGKDRRKHDGPDDPAPARRDGGT